MNCPCCFQEILSTGGCTVCSLQTIWCHCGARFCAAHHSKEAAEHTSKCGIWSNQGPTLGAGPTLSTTVELVLPAMIGAQSWD